MTEETIKHKISDWYTVDSPKGITELAKAILEQHEAEMVDRLQKLSDELNEEFIKCSNFEYSIKIKEVTNNHITLFKNRNK